MRHFLAQIFHFLHEKNVKNTMKKIMGDHLKKVKVCQKWGHKNLKKPLIYDSHEN